MNPELTPYHGRPADDSDLAPEERQLARKLAELRNLAPSEAYRARSATELQRRIAAAAPRRRSWGAGIWATPALRMAAAIGVIVLALLGTSYAAAQSLPGDALYPLKRDFEELHAGLSSIQGQAELRLNLADRRLGELQRLIERGATAGQIARAADEYRAAAAQLGRAPADMRLLRVHAGILEVLRSQAAPDIQPLLDDLLAAAQQMLKGTSAAPPMPGPSERPTATTQPSETALPLPSKTATPTATPVPPTNTPTPTDTPTPSPTALPTATPKPTRIPPRPAAKPRPSATPTEAAVPTEILPTATPAAVEVPTAIEATIAPTEAPTAEPQTAPHRPKPTRAPEPARTPEPTRPPEPTPEPTHAPEPTRAPTSTHAPEPTRQPTATHAPEPPRQPTATPI